MLKISINEKLKDICQNLLAVQQLSEDFKSSVVAPDTIVKLDLLHEFDKSLSQLLMIFNADQLGRNEAEINVTIFELLAQGLATLKICKQEIVESGGYEEAARFRDIEIHIEVLINYWRLFSHCNKTVNIKVK